MLPFLVASTLLAAGLLLVMSEEFPRLPKTLRRLSTRLARATLGRKVFVCALIAIIAVPSMLTLVGAGRGGTWLLLLIYLFFRLFIMSSV